MDNGRRSLYYKIVFDSLLKYIIPALVKKKPARQSAALTQVDDLFRKMCLRCIYGFYNSGLKCGIGHYTDHLDIMK